MRFSHQYRMHALLCQHVTDRNPDPNLSPNSLYRQNSLFPVGGDITRFHCIDGTPIYVTLAERSKANLDLWNLFIAIVSLC